MHSLPVRKRQGTSLPYENITMLAWKFGKWLVFVQVWVASYVIFTSTGKLVMFRADMMNSTSLASQTTDLDNAIINPTQLHEEGVVGREASEDNTGSVGSSSVYPTQPLEGPGLTASDNTGSAGSATQLLQEGPGRTTSDNTESAASINPTQLQEGPGLRTSDNTESAGSTSMNTDLTPDHPVHCYNHTFCCGNWGVNADQWWIHHPHWELAKEDEESFCFSPMQGQDERVKFLKKLHWMQWNVNIDLNLADDNINTKELARAHPEGFQYAVNCSNAAPSIPISSGYGASIAHLQNAFWFAYRNNKPFHYLRRGPWIYRTRNTSHPWGYCPDMDHTCDFLDVSPCSHDRLNERDMRSKQLRPHKNETMPYLWMRAYMTRPHQKMRHQLALQKLKYLPRLPQDECVALHVRRSDVGFIREPFRRYAAVQEYLDLLPPREDNTTKTTILLLTDDVSTIEEIQTYLSGDRSPYEFVYIDKPRNRGVEAGFEGHVPAKSDGPEELLAILLEMQLAQRCHSLVHGKSGFANLLADSMLTRTYPSQKDRFKKYYLDTEVTQEEVRAKFAMQPEKRTNYYWEVVQEFYAQRNMTAIKERMAVRRKRRHRQRRRR